MFTILFAILNGVSAYLTIPLLGTLFQESATKQTKVETSSIEKTSFNQLKNKTTDAELKSISAPVLASVLALLLSALFAGFITSVVLSIVFVFQISFLSRIDLEMSLDHNISN